MPLVASELLCLHENKVEHRDLNKAYVQILALNNPILNNPRSLFPVSAVPPVPPFTITCSLLTVHAFLTSLVRAR